LISTVWLLLWLGAVGCDHGGIAARDSGVDLPINHSQPDSGADLSSDPALPDSGTDLSSDRALPDLGVDRSSDRALPDSGVDVTGDRSGQESNANGSGDSSPSALGVDPSKYIDELSTDEIQRLCSWMSGVVKPGVRACPGGTTITTYAASECADQTRNAHPPHCLVSLLEDCAISTGGDSCKTLVTDACKTYIACATSH
jgi:hypothetical protein